MADVTVALTGNASTSAVGTAGVESAAILSGASQANTGIGILGAPGVVSLTLPAPQLIVRQTAAIVATLPTPVLYAAGIAGNVGAVSLTLPLPQLTLDMLGRDGALATASLTLPTPPVSIGGFTGATGSISLMLPTPVLSVASANSAALSLPTPQVQAQGTTGVTGTVLLTLPTPQAAVTGSVPFVGQVALALPAPVVELAGAVGSAARINAQLARFALSIQGATGIVGTVTMMLPVGRFTAAGYQPGVGAVQLVLPALQLQITGRAGTSISNPTTLAMQTEMLSLSTYSNYPFNSFAKFGGLVLGASSAGIFALTGADDSGSPIQSAARVGISDFGTSHLKRVDRIYVGYRADGNLVLRVFTDEVTQRDYLLQSSQRVGLHGNHARLGKGLVARYWQFEVRNQNGGDFSMDIIELKPTKLVRRVGGTDA